MMEYIVLSVGIQMLMWYCVSIWISCVSCEVFDRTEGITVKIDKQQDNKTGK